MRKSWSSTFNGYISVREGGGSEKVKGVNHKLVRAGQY